MTEKVQTPNYDPPSLLMRSHHVLQVAADHHQHGHVATATTRLKPAQDQRDRRLSRQHAVYLPDHSGEYAMHTSADIVDASKSILLTDFY
ncbi:MAG: hypothetical protein ACKODB_07505, partial [Betaproteobacteria bacterium]